MSRDPRKKPHLMEIDPERPGFGEALSGRAGVGMMIYSRACTTVLVFLLAVGLFSLVH